MPEREVLQPEDLPRAILLDVLVLIYASFPPLDQPSGMRILDALVGAGRHHAAETAFGSSTFDINVDNALDLRVIEKEAVNWAISAVHEGFRESIDVETLDALLAIVAAAEELDTGIGVVRVELSHFFVQTLVEVVAVFILQFPYCFWSACAVGSEVEVAAADLLPGLCQDVSANLADDVSISLTTQPRDFLLQLCHDL